MSILMTDTMSFQNPEVTKRVFSVADKNRDGGLTEQEFKSMLGGLGTPPTLLKNAWRKAKKHNGKVNEYEAIKLGERFGHRVDKHTQASLGNLINSMNNNITNNAMANINQSLAQQNTIPIALDAGQSFGLNTGFSSNSLSNGVGNAPIGLGLSISV